MTKIVYNRCFGGFNLSEKAVLRYCEIKGIKMYVERDKYGIPVYWRIQEGERPEIPQGADWYRLPAEERSALNANYKAATLDVRDIARDDPTLVQVVEELGTEANSTHSELAIAEIPAGARYRIDEYDGRESVMTPDDYEWQTA